MTPGNQLVLGSLALLAVGVLLGTLFNFLSNSPRLFDHRLRRELKRERKRELRELNSKPIVIEAGESKPGQPASTETKIFCYVIAFLAIVLCFPYGLPIGLGLIAVANRHRDPE